MSAAHKFHQARPTEYEGVRFRSKSEAIFARTLDLMHIQWRYEPEEYQLDDGWGPDFWLIVPRRVGFGSFLCEYKPARPTDTYLGELFDRYADLGLRKVSHKMMVVYGNLYEENAGGDVLIFNGGQWESDPQFWAAFAWQIPAARQHRFDLAEKNTITIPRMDAKDAERVTEQHKRQAQASGISWK